MQLDLEFFYICIQFKFKENLVLYLEIVQKRLDQNFFLFAVNYAVSLYNDIDVILSLTQLNGQYIIYARSMVQISDKKKLH